jgi:sigma-B regulation protein RsbU (phosphoserine phosphatase)
MMRRNALEAGPLAGMSPRMGSAIWESLKDKVSMLFVIDTEDSMSVVRVLGISSEATSTPDDVVKQNSKWLAGIKAKSVSAFQPNLAGGSHIVCVPMRGQGGLIMVAVVPTLDLERNLLAYVNRSANTGAMLIDEQGTFVSASLGNVRGKNISDFKDPRIRQLATAYMKSHIGDTRVFERPEMLGDAQLKPGMSTIEPVKVLGQSMWFVIISSSLDDVDNLVKPIFADAIVWAGVVMIAVLAILLSTATQMVRSRLRLERAQLEIINKELTQAREIQLNWLPDQPCSIQLVDIAAVNTPASHVSGDFYNWFELPDGRLVVLIGDVTGHGMGAAFLMATTQLLVRTTMPRHSDPGLCMEEVNRHLCTQVFSGQFVTMMILVMDLQNGVIDVANAGHPAPLISQGESFAPLEIEPQLVLGVDVDTVFPSQRFPLGKGVSVLLYTDGVPDAQAANGNRFGTEGVRNTLFGRYPSAKEMVDAVIHAVDDFRTGRDLGDDLTLVAIQLQTATAPNEAILEAV